MSVEKIKLKRKFKYNGVELPDPGGSLRPEEVKDLYAKTGYGGLLNAIVKGPTQEGEDLVYEFKASVGTKG